MSVDPAFNALVHEAIEAWPSQSPEAEVWQLAKSAAGIRQLRVAPATLATQARMERRLSEMLAGNTGESAASWAAGWLGVGPRPRGLATRLAATGMLLAAAGSAGTAATGATPGDMVESAGGIVKDVALSFGSPGSAPDADTPPFAATATVTPTPSVDPTADVSPAAAAEDTPEPEATEGAGVQSASAPLRNNVAPLPSGGLTNSAPTAAPTATRSVTPTVETHLPGAPENTRTPSPTPTIAPPTPTPSPTAIPTPTAPGNSKSESQQSFTVADAGTVHVLREGPRLKIQGVTPANGYSATILEPDGLEVEVLFTRATNQWRFTARVNGDQIQGVVSP